MGGRVGGTEVEKVRRRKLGGLSEGGRAEVVQPPVEGHYLTVREFITSHTHTDGWGGSVSSWP